MHERGNVDGQPDVTVVLFVNLELCHEGCRALLEGVLVLARFFRVLDGEDLLLLVQLPLDLRRRRRSAVAAVQFLREGHFLPLSKVAVVADPLREPG